jgi:hypothetical protein
MRRGQDKPDRSNEHPGQATKIRHLVLSPLPKRKSIGTIKT